MDEIAELKAQIAALQGKVARFEVMQNRGRGAVPAEIVDKQAAPGVRLDVGASISFPVVASSFVAPDKKQLVEIRELVGSIYPQLMNSEHCAQWHRHVSHEEHEEAYYKMLAAALVALFSGMRALSKPDVTRYWTEHRDYCVSFLRSIGKPSEILIYEPVFGCGFGDKIDPIFRAVHGWLFAKPRAFTSCWAPA